MRHDIRKTVNSSSKTTVNKKITGTGFDFVTISSVLILILLTAYIDIYCGRNQNLSCRFFDIPKQNERKK